MARRFEFREGRSQKFWVIDLSGDSFTVTFGKVGTAGRTQTKPFSSAAEARAQHDKLVAEKTKKGYVEVGGGDKATKPRGREAAASRAPAKPPPAVDDGDPLVKPVVAARKKASAEDGFDLDPWTGAPDWEEPDFAEIEKRLKMPLGETGRALVRLLHMAKPSDPVNAFWYAWTTFEGFHEGVSPRALASPDTPKDVRPFATERGDSSHFGVWTGGPADVPLDGRPVVYVSKEGKVEVYGSDLAGFLARRAGGGDDDLERRVSKLFRAIPAVASSKRETPPDLDELREAARAPAKAAPGSAGEVLRHRWTGFEWITELALRGDGGVLAVCETELQIVDVATGEKLETVEFDSAPTRPCFAPDGTLYVVADGSIVELDGKSWRARRRYSIGHVTNKDGHLGATDAHVVAGCFDRLIVLDRKDLAVVHDLRAKHPTYALSAHPNGELVVTNEIGQLGLWDIARGKRLRTLKDTREAPARVFDGAAISADGRRVYAASDSWVLGWDLGSGHLEHAWERGDDYSNDTALAFHPDGRHLFLVDTLGISAWDVVTGKLVATLPPEGKGSALREFQGGVITPDGELLIAGYREKTLRVWSVPAILAGGIRKGKKKRKSG